jgi:hypothetical protein
MSCYAQLQVYRFDSRAGLRPFLHRVTNVKHSRPSKANISGAERRGLTCEPLQRKRKRGAGALQTKSCRGLLLYYSTCLYLLLLRFAVDNAWTCTGGKRKGMDDWQPERKRGTGRGHWNRGRKWNSKWCIYMKSEKNERALRALFVEFSFEVFALALDAMKKKARGNLLPSFLPLTCLYYAGGPSGRTDSLLVAVRSWKSCTLRSR